MLISTLVQQLILKQFDCDKYCKTVFFFFCANNVDTMCGLAKLPSFSSPSTVTKKALAGMMIKEWKQPKWFIFGEIPCGHPCSLWDPRIQRGSTSPQQNSGGSSLGKKALVTWPWQYPKIGKWQKWKSVFSIENNNMLMSFGKKLVTL